MKRIKLPCNAQKYVMFPFYKNGKPIEENTPLWGMTIKNAGSMKFRWFLENENREKILNEICSESSLKTKPKVCSVQLDHTKIVANPEYASDVRFNIADGIVTSHKHLMPVVTIADCLALYLFDSETGAFGIVHSGWKGTGIVLNAISIMKKRYDSKPENISVSLSAHIRSCCYIVNKERADYFTKNFSKDCAEPFDEKDGSTILKGWNNLKGPLFRLSLEKANLHLLEKAGIKEENIAILDECTCSNEMFGSNRRETLEGVPFTVQAAFVRF